MAEKATLQARRELHKHRVTGNSVSMGQSAGRVAAIAAKKNKLPRDVTWKETGIHFDG